MLNVKELVMDYVNNHHHKLVHKFIQLVQIRIVKIILELMVYAFYQELLLKPVQDLMHVHKQHHKVHVH
jgi:hypothetical protein